jgi:hypothetical protein
VHHVAGFLRRGLAFFLISLLALLVGNLPFRGAGSFQKSAILATSLFRTRSRAAGSDRGLIVWGSHGRVAVTIFCEGFRNPGPQPVFQRWQRLRAAPVRRGGYWGFRANFVRHRTRLVPV